ncbi:hypothetical protein [Providencia huaxiensis]|uniref:hypothetical protein n=1 Tax=Providencia huaxiensis TaxID=2027290 RepID=UPI0034DDC1BA
MRILLYFILTLIPFYSLSEINPFKILSLQSRSDDYNSRSVLLPVDTDCIERPHFRGALPLHAEIDKTYYGYSNRCYWEAYKDVSVQSFGGASAVVIADWRPLLALPQQQEDAGAICRKKPIIEKAYFSDPWFQNDGYYANYDGCKYYSPCNNSSCNQDYSDYWPISEADFFHYESKLLDYNPNSGNDYDNSEWVPPPAPSHIQVGKYTGVTDLVNYMWYQHEEHCKYLRNKYPDKTIICGGFQFVFIPRNSLPLRKFPENYPNNYYCYVNSLDLDDIGNNICYLNDNLVIEYGSITECYLTENNKCRGNDGNNNGNGNGGNDIFSADTNATVHRNEDAISDVREAVKYNSWNIHELLDDSKKTNNSLDEILQILKEDNGNGNGNGNGNSLGYNYHPDLKKFNDDLNKNHEELMNHLGNIDNGDFSQLKGKFDSELNNYNDSALSEIDGYLNSLFDNMPNLFVQFKLPSEFYGNNSGQCIPINKTYSLDFTQGVKYDLKFNTSLTCEYYDNYFRQVIEFVFYFLTAVVCYRLYHRYITNSF